MTSSFRKLVLVLSATSLIVAVVILAVRWTGTSGLVMANSAGPAGGDFINMWTAGRMVIDGQTSDIYDPTAFLEYQQTLVSESIGFRIWAYPPHSLLLAVPFGLLGYWLALSLWSLLGLGLLVFGARRFGFDWIETVVLVLSPAALMCVYYGQTGNLAGGLLLLALAHRRPRDGVSMASTGALTLKPQLGFMIPVLWAFTRRWQLIAGAALVTIALTGIATLLFGLDAWDGYVNETLPVLNEFERTGSGPFEWMIPSFFMAARIITDDGDFAVNFHFAIAAIVLAFTLRHLWRSNSRQQQTALLLVATATITPYLHIYDMSLLVAASFLIARLWATGCTDGNAWGERAIIIAWAMPVVTYSMNSFGVPISPILLLLLLALTINAPVRNDEPTDESQASEAGQAASSSTT